MHTVMSIMLITISSSNNKTSGIKNPSKTLLTAINGAITVESNVKLLSVQQATCIVYKGATSKIVVIYHSTYLPQG